MILIGVGRGAGWLGNIGRARCLYSIHDRAFQPILALSQEYNTIQIALGAAERIYRMLQTKPTIQSPTSPTRLEIARRHRVS